MAGGQATQAFDRENCTQLAHGVVLKANVRNACIILDIQDTSIWKLVPKQSMYILHAM